MPHLNRRVLPQLHYVLASALLLGCGGQPGNDETASPEPNGGGVMKKMDVDPKDITFRDDVDAEKAASFLAAVPKGLDGLAFVDTSNRRVALEDYLGKKNVLLVFTEGFAGMLCPFCKAQTSRLVANYDKFAELDTEILVVYPGERDHLDEFLEAARSGGQVERVPFPIVLDEDLSATRFFQIESKLAHPSTYVIDKAGKVRFAYVGEDMSPDRPSVNALLRELAETEG